MELEQWWICDDLKCFKHNEWIVWKGKYSFIFTLKVQSTKYPLISKRKGKEESRSYWSWGEIMSDKITFSHIWCRHCWTYIVLLLMEIEETLDDLVEHSIDCRQWRKESQRRPNTFSFLT